MERSKLLLRTAFVCMASDGSINEQEFDLVKKFIIRDGLCEESDIDHELGELLMEFNQDSSRFIRRFFETLKQDTLSREDQLSILSYAISIIRADDVIDYREITFFKMIRSFMQLSDHEIIEEIDDAEEYLQRDVSDSKETESLMDKFVSSKYQINTINSLPKS